MQFRVEWYRGNEIYRVENCVDMADALEAAYGQWDIEQDRHDATAVVVSDGSGYRILRLSAPVHRRQRSPSYINGALEGAVLTEPLQTRTIKRKGRRGKQQ
jgi:hypothetical protein